MDPEAASEIGPVGRSTSGGLSGRTSLERGEDQPPIAIPRASHGAVTALSEVFEAAIGHVTRHLVLVGSLSRLLVCDTGIHGSNQREDGRRVLAARTVMPHGTTVHGIVIRRSPESLERYAYRVVAYGARYVVVLGLRMGGRGPELEQLAVRALDKWVLAVDAQLYLGGMWMAIGMIDGSVEVCQTMGAGSGSIRMVGARQAGPKRCMLYSMDLVSDMVQVGDGTCAYDVRVAGGTVLFDVVVWRLCVTIGDSDPGVALIRKTHSAVYEGGHTGSVHCICWDADGERLASGSDDRTVQVWAAPWAGNRSTEEEMGEAMREEMRMNSWIRAFDHAGRVWSLRFSGPGDVLYTGCEDGRVTGWDVGRGGEVAKWGSGKGVRVIRVFGRMVVTGGAEGSVRIWDADGGVGRTARGTVTLRACFGDGESSGEKTASIKAMKLIDGGRRLLVATDDGRLVDVDVTDVATGDEPAAMEKISGKISEKMSETEQVIYSTGSVYRPLVNIRAHEKGQSCGPSHGTFEKTVVACCDACGALHVLWFEDRNEPVSLVLDGTTEFSHRIIDVFFLVHWGRLMMLCYTAADVLELYDVSSTSVARHVASCASRLGCRVTAAGFTSWMSMERRRSTYVVLGLAQGGVAVCEIWDRDLAHVVDGTSQMAPSNLTVLSYQSRGHNKTPVQTVWVSTNYEDGNHLIIETTAADFCVQRYTLAARCQSGLERNHEVRLEAVKTIVRRYDRTAMGFFASKFVLWDLDMDVQVCEFPSAGWNRPWALHVADGRDIGCPSVTFCYTSGTGDIRVFKRHLKCCPPYAIVTGSHGREINSVVDVAGTLITAGADARIFSATWTGNDCGEDGTRYSRGGDLTSMHDMTLAARHVSTQPFGTSTRVLRALETSPNTYLVVSGGARSIMTAWSVRVCDDSSRVVGHRLLSAFANPAVRDREGRALSSAASLDAVDMRVTALALAKVSIRGDTSPLAAIGLSTAELEVRHVPSTLANTHLGLPMHQKLHDWEFVAHITTAYPVLSAIWMDSIVWAGTTGGELIAWDPQTGLVETYAAIHACGINAMVAVPESGAIITGGDDQSLSVFSIEAREQSCVVRNAHASAIKDVVVIDGRASRRAGGSRTLCSVGLDQYLRVWELCVSNEATTLTCCESTMLQVHEPAACCVGSDGSTARWVTVAGRGIERIDLVL